MPKVFLVSKMPSALEKSYDHLNLYADDIKNMNSDLGCIPNDLVLLVSCGTTEEGKFDQNAIDHYSKMIDACLENGVEPMVTFHHFSHPLWFEKKVLLNVKRTFTTFIALQKNFFKIIQTELPIGVLITTVLLLLLWGLGVFPPRVNAPKRMGNVLLNPYAFS